MDSERLCSKRKTTQKYSTNRDACIKMLLRYNVTKQVIYDAPNFSANLLEYDGRCNVSQLRNGTIEVSSYFLNCSSNRFVPNLYRKRYEFNCEFLNRGNVGLYRAFAYSFLFLFIVFDFLCNHIPDILLNKQRRQYLRSKGCGNQINQGKTMITIKVIN